MHRNSTKRTHKLTCHNRQQIYFCTQLYSPRIRAVYKVDALNLNARYPRQTALCVVAAKAHLHGIFFPMLINNKHLCLNFFSQEVVVYKHHVDNRHLVVWGCFTKVTARQRLWFTVNCKSAVSHI